MMNNFIHEVIKTNIKTNIQNKMRKIILKPKTLKDLMLLIKVGESKIVKYHEYVPEHVRRVASRLNKEGYVYKANASQVDGGIIVTRLK